MPERSGLRSPMPIRWFRTIGLPARSSSKQMRYVERLKSIVGRNMVTWCVPSTLSCTSSSKIIAISTAPISD
ncbi:hypothetical protein D3C71_2147490 [compost metagenome]